MKEDKIKEIKAQLISISKDAHHAESLISELLRLQKQECEMNKLIDIPLSDVKETIDFGANALHRIAGGYVWEAKGGMTTVVDWRMQSVVNMLADVYKIHHAEDDSDEHQEAFRPYIDAVSIIMQAPIFSSLDARALFDNAASILRTFNEYTNEHYTNAEAVPESENDIRENIEAENMAKGLEALANTPLPPED